MTPKATFARRSMSVFMECSSTRTPRRRCRRSDSSRTSDRCGRGRERPNTNVCRTGQPQRMSGGTQRRSGGDDIVDHQNVECLLHGSRPKNRTLQTVAARTTGLSETAFAFEKSPTGHSESASHDAGQQFALVVTACSRTTSRRGRPGDHVDRGRRRITPNVGHQTFGQ